MFGSIGMPELILIFVVALLVFGPKKLPEIGKSIGKGLAEFKRASDDLKRTIEHEIEQSKNEASAIKEQVAGVFPREVPSFTKTSEGEPSFAKASSSAKATEDQSSFAKATEDKSEDKPPAGEAAASLSAPASPTPEARPIEPS